MDAPDPELALFASEVVRSALGSSARLAQVVAWPAASGQAVWQLIVTGAARPLVLKAATTEAAASSAVDFERTAAVSALAERAGVPVARVLAAGTAPAVGPWSYLLTEQLDGVEWRSLRPRLSEAGVRSAHRQIATAVLACQSIRFGSYGQLDRDGRPDDDDLGSALRLRARLRTAPSRIALAEEVLEREAGLFATPTQAPTLTHDDLHHANLLFTMQGDSPRLAGILDWDKAWAGPPESDVARMAWWDDMTGPGFWEVYGDGARSDRQARRWLVHQLLWCLEYPVSSARHRCDTVDLCHRLGLRPPPTAGGN